MSAARVAATVGGGAYAAIVEWPNDGPEPVVCCRDASGAPVPRPLPADWTRTEVSDAVARCPACGAVAYDEVLTTDGSRGGRGGHGHDGPLEPCRIVCPASVWKQVRRCGHQEGAGSSLMRLSTREDDDEAEAAKAARIACHRAQARVQKRYSDTMTLRGVSFPIYAAETWLASVRGTQLVAGSPSADTTT